jgi:N-acetylglucosamine malate deacetylase 1
MNTNKLDVMAVGAHPDDIEFGCGGILAKMSAQNKSMVFVDLTLGDKGTNGTPEIRKKEGEAAARILGAERVYLDFKDCEVFDTYEGRLKLVALIRKYKPRLILGPLWRGQQTHPDHLACGNMLRYACRYARFAKILPDIPIHTPEGILHYLYPGGEESDFIIDVSAHTENWKKMMACHSSQMQTMNFIDNVLRRASMLGVLIGKEYAQGLVKGNPIEIDDLMSVAKSTREI